MAGGVGLDPFAVMEECETNRKGGMREDNLFATRAPAMHPDHP